MIRLVDDYRPSVVAANLDPEESKALIKKLQEIRKTTKPRLVPDDEFTTAEKMITNFVCAGLGNREYHFLNQHIFIHYQDFKTYIEKYMYDKWSERQILPSHRVHIYFLDGDMINNDLHDFIVECGKFTKKKVILHIRTADYKRFPEFKGNIDKLLRNLDNWKIYFEGPRALIEYNMGNDKFLRLSYRYLIGARTLLFSRSQGASIRRTINNGHISKTILSDEPLDIGNPGD